MLPLSPETRARLEALFLGKDRAEAVSLLETECADNLPSCENLDMYGLERIRFAVLKLSEGRLPRLKHEIDEAKKDWRDTLMAAGFGYDVEAHQSWFPARKP